MQTMLGFGQLRSFLWAFAFTSAHPPPIFLLFLYVYPASGFVHARVSSALCKFAPTPLSPFRVAPTFLSFGLRTPWRDTANYTVVNRPANLSRPQFVRLNFSVPYRASPRHPLHLSSLSWFRCGKRRSWSGSDQKGAWARLSVNAFSQFTQGTVVKRLRARRNIYYSRT